MTAGVAVIPPKTSDRPSLHLRYLRSPGAEKGVELNSHDRAHLRAPRAS